MKLEDYTLMCSARLRQHVQFNDGDDRIHIHSRIKHPLWVRIATNESARQLTYLFLQVLTNGCKRI